jgi:lipopolysaccharide transport system ATP-binding protein
VTALAIRTEHLAKRYTIGAGHSPDATLRDAIADRTATALRAARDVLHGRLGEAGTERTLWALDDVTCEIQKGDLVGIIGRNGAGKSTLLKIISRITAPTHGRVGINGRVGSLLDVGTGFHPELTGRENVFLYGSILGMRQSEVRRRFDEIIDFAEVGRFLDTPIKRFSSGMQVRLAFAVAAHLEPDVLLVDEVLAVGDVAFQRKCLGRMGEAAGEGRTVLFVSHNLAVIQALCRRGMLLDRGRLRYDGSIEDAVALYLHDLEQAMSTELKERTDRSGWEVVRLTRVEVRGAAGEGSMLTTGSPAVFVFDVDEFLASTSCLLTIYDDLGHPVAEFRSSVDSPEDIDDSTEQTRFVCTIDELPLVPGRYRVDVEISAQGHLQDAIEGAATFEVEQGVLAGRPVAENSQRGPVAIRHRWTRPVA